jgi:uncharacterized protein YlxW (UPF0749 family)
MKKQLPALLAALVVTGFIGLAMLAASANALLNRNGTVVSNEPAAASSANVSADQTQIEQLQARINEYQQREVQYQQMLDRDQKQIQQFQQLLLVMQQAGMIQIRDDGTILLNTGRRN